MIVQLFQPKSNRFTAVFSSLYHKMAIILFTLWKLLCVFVYKRFPVFQRYSTERYDCLLLFELVI